MFGFSLEEEAVMQLLGHQEKEGEELSDSLWLANSAILDELNLKEHCIFDARRMAKDFTAIVIFLNLLIAVLGLGLADLFQS
jgi:hypothetical protein